MAEDLKKKILCARFVPHTLTTEQKEHRIASSEDLIAAADEDPNFLKTIVTGDESWCLEYDPETKRQSSEWTSPGKGRPMKVRASKSKTKTMLLLFFDSRGIIHHEFLRQGSTVTGAFYKDVLHRLLKRMRRRVMENLAKVGTCYMVGRKRNIERNNSSPTKTESDFGPAEIRERVLTTAKFTKGKGQQQLKRFELVDACKEAYAAFIFVGSKIGNESKVTLIRAKNRISPIKPLIIPRLELMACSIGARLVNSVIKTLGVASIKVTLWSDSTVAL
ncbi:HTH_48 domain-containing protein [Nephila pilipes]|uniref:HTH_48 domain-containing protein n=2 Tax=Nephila pilipes TaxID=299642 RepID=A0A8X6T2G5_NEPPI|nr:HTH_48 domain-containing protein [Nephila pilipes]